MPGKIVKLQIWDTAGDQRFRNLISTHYRGADGIMLIYDVTDEESFVNLPSWLDEIRRTGCTEAARLLIGTKCDLLTRKIVDTRRAKAFAKSEGLDLVQTSAKTVRNVETAFFTMAKKILENVQNAELMNKSDDVIRLTDGVAVGDDEVTWGSYCWW